MARSLLEQAGFAGGLLDIMLGIEWVECLEPTEAVCTCHPELPRRKGLHFWDAVGDLKYVWPESPDYDPVIAAKWGPSIGPAQIRSLRHPQDYPFPDPLRIAEQLRDPFYNAAAAWELSHHGTYFTSWSPYKSGTYLPHVGEDFVLHEGHRNAHLWNI